MKVLVLGATGMLGSALMRVLVESDSLDVVGTVRSEDSGRRFRPEIRERLVVVAEARDANGVSELLGRVSPDAVVNCVSPSRESIRNQDALALIPLCALLPHQLSALCADFGARLVHISTDGVFSGRKGAYTEDDAPDATDAYGLSKYLGEVRAAHAVTIRTSMIGHELRGSDGLLEWFLAQTDRCKCFARAIFSGLPAIVLAQVIRDHVLPRPELSGVYHVAAQPITKCELLRLIARIYGKKIEIVPEDAAPIDRSLNASRFRAATGYVAPDWPTLIQTMHSLR